MSLTNDILNELTQKHPKACQLLVALCQAVDLELKANAQHSEVANANLSELDRHLAATLENLALSDSTPVESDHYLSVLHTVFAHLRQRGVELSSASSEKDIVLFLKQHRTHSPSSSMTIDGKPENHYRT